MINVGEALQRFVFTSDKGFTLRNGQVSNYYIDVRTALLHPYYLEAIAAKMIELAKVKGVYFQSVGGMESGSITLSTAISLQSKCYNFYIRKEFKDYGTRKRVEGFPTSPCILVEDVVTTGRTLVEAAQALMHENPSCRIVGALAVVDRGHVDLDKIFEDVPVYSLFKAEELIAK